MADSVQALWWIPSGTKPYEKESYKCKTQMVCRIRVTRVPVRTPSSFASSSPRLHISHCCWDSALPLPVFFCTAFAQRKVTLTCWGLAHTALSSEETVTSSCWLRCSVMSPFAWFSRNSVSSTPLQNSFDYSVPSRPQLLCGYIIVK